MVAAASAKARTVAARCESLAACRQNQAEVRLRPDSEQRVCDQTDDPPHEEAVSTEGTEEEFQAIASDQIAEVEEVVGPEVDVRDG